MKNRLNIDKGTYISVIAAILSIVIFICVLSFSLKAAFNPDFEYKTEKSKIDALISVGAPLSKMNLERIFSSMGHSYTDVNGSVYEPISAEFRKSLEEKDKKGENRFLSVEEIIYIVSDTIAIYDSYDILRLRDKNGEIMEQIVPLKAKQNWQNPLHIASSKRISDILHIIEYRVSTLTSKIARGNDANGSRFYYPLKVTYGNKDIDQISFDRERRFIFSDSKVENGNQGSIIFERGPKNLTLLFPKELDVNDSKTKVIYQNNIKIAEEEQKILKSNKCEPSLTRNITPEYFYGKVSARLFIYGGQLFVVDGQNGYFEKVLSENEKILSTAISFDKKLQKYILYISIANKNDSFVLSYDGDFELKRVLEGKNQMLVLAENLSDDYESVSVHRGNIVKNKKYLSMITWEDEPVYIF